MKLCSCASLVARVESRSVRRRSLIPPPSPPPPPRYRNQSVCKVERFPTPPPAHGPKENQYIYSLDPTNVADQEKKLFCSAVVNVYSSVYGSKNRLIVRSAVISGLDQNSEYLENLWSSIQRTARGAHTFYVILFSISTSGRGRLSFTRVARNGFATDKPVALANPDRIGIWKC